mgnify:CR=1 FL=1
MKQEILDRIKALGGNVDNVKGTSLQDDLHAITFDTVLYPRPTDTPWAAADDTEPIYGIGDFFDQNEELFNTNKDAFLKKVIDHYYVITKEGRGQMFWVAKPFTPYKEGTADFDEWNDDFTDEEEVNLSEVYKHTNDPKPDFIELIYSYGFPDNYYVCLTDPIPENQTLFGTDHEVFFREVSNLGTLEDFLKRFMTKEELIEIIKKKVGN